MSKAEFIWLYEKKNLTVNYHPHLNNLFKIIKIFGGVGEGKRLLPAHVSSDSIITTANKDSRDSKSCHRKKKETLFF